jgi:hypothetical protein
MEAALPFQAPDPYAEDEDEAAEEAGEGESS